MTTVDPQLFNSLLPGKTFQEACRITGKYGYKTHCALNDGVQRPNTFKNEPGGVYVEIRSQHIHKVIRIVPLPQPNLVEPPDLRSSNRSEEQKSDVIKLI